MSVEAIRALREMREARAAMRAEQLEPGMDIYASANFVMERLESGPSIVAVTCESHWDACLVLLAYGNMPK